MRKIMIIFVGMVLFSVMVAANTETRFTVEFRGQAYVDGELVPDGTLVTLWANDGEELMDTAVAGYGKGYFNHLEIRWDDPNTLKDEGVTYDDSTHEGITFKIGDREVLEEEFVTKAERGKTKNIDLYVGKMPKVVQMPAGEEFSAGLFFIIAMLVVIGVIIFVYLVKTKEKKKKR